MSIVRSSGRRKQSKAKSNEALNKLVSGTRMIEKQNATSSQLTNELTALYEKCPQLRDAEKYGNHRLNQRHAVLKYAPKNGVGAEIGVFTGMFSEVLAMKTHPQKMFLVDPWEKLHGDFFPNWGRYTSYQSVPTSDAMAAATLRSTKMSCDCEVVNDFGIEWLQTFSAPFLDWVYLDAKHTYEAALADLHQIARYLKPTGVIMGDDAWIDSVQQDFGVAAALHEFIEERPFELLYLDNYGQWAITAQT